MKSVLLYNCYPKTIWKAVTNSLLSVVPHDDIYVHITMPPLVRVFPHFVKAYFRRFPKVKGVLLSPNVPGVGETIGFDAMRRSIDFSDYEIATYIHSKGTSARHKNGPEIADWTELMRYFVVERHELCVEAFRNGYSLYGVELANLSSPSDWDKANYPDTKFLYSGNFVSVNLNSLKSPFLSTPCKADYYGVERFWGTLCPLSEAYSAHDSHVDHYDNCYPGEFYKDPR